MRKLVVNEHLTVDGVMQAPALPDEDRSGGFEHGGWHVPYVDASFMRLVGGAIGQTDAYLFGRRTYEVMARFWPNAPADDLFAQTLNNTPKYVASTTLTEPLSWQGSTLLRGDLLDAVRALKAQPGGTISVLGSGVLVRELTRLDLVDEYRLMIDPLLLGAGKRLFDHTGPRRPLRLIDVATTDVGVVVLRYEPSR